MEIKEEIVRRVPEEWRDEFRNFLEKGDASPAFLDFLDHDAAAQSAVDDALNAQAEDLHRAGAAVLTDAAPASAPRPARRRRMSDLLSGPTFARFAVAAGVLLVVGMGVALWEQYRRADVAEMQRGFAAMQPSATKQGPTLAEAKEQYKAVKAERDRLAARPSTSGNPGGDVLVMHRFDQDGPEEDYSDSDTGLKSIWSPVSKLFTSKELADGQILWNQSAAAQCQVKLNSGDREDRLKAISGLKSMGRRARKLAPDLVRLYSRDERDPEVKKAVGEALAAIDPEAAEKAGVDLGKKDEDRLARQRVADELERSRRWVLALGIHDLGDEAPEARSAAADVLADLGPEAKDAVPELRYRIGKENEEAVKDKMEAALSKIDKVAAAETFVETADVPATAPPGN